MNFDKYLMSPVQAKSYMIYIPPEGLSNLLEKVTIMEYVYVYITFKIK